MFFKWSQNLFELALIYLREREFCISVQKVHNNRFYVYARKWWKSENIQKYLGIISSNLLVQLFHPEEIEAFRRNFSLNHVLDCRTTSQNMPAYRVIFPVNRQKHYVFTKIALGSTYA